MSAQLDTAAERSTYDSHDVFGLKITPTTASELLGLVSQNVSEGRQAIIASQNLHGVKVTLESPHVQALHALDRTFVHIDGMPLVALCRLRGKPVGRRHRVTLLDIIWPLLARAEERKWRVFWLSGSPDVVMEGLSRIRRRLPNLVIDGHTGFFEDDSPVLDHIASFRPHLILVGMGMGRQEQWILQHHARLEPASIFTVGACLEYISGAAKTPPRWIGQVGLEWAFRLASNPRRFARRYIVEPWIVAAYLARIAISEVERPAHGGARGRELIVVTDVLPKYQVGRERCGQGEYLARMARHFAESGWRVTWLLHRPRVRASLIAGDALEFDLVGRQIAKVGSRYLIWSPASVVSAALYRLFLIQPPAVRAALASARRAWRGLQGYTHIIGAFTSARDGRFIRKCLLRRRPAVVLYDSIFSYCGKGYAESEWIVTLDVKCDRARSFARSGYRTLPRDLSEDRERAILQASGNLIAIQDDEAVRLRAMAPQARVVVAPISVAGGVWPRCDAMTHKRCIFVGSGVMPNVDGIMWFLDSCWPAVLRRSPDAELSIYGTVCLQLGDVPTGVRLEGVVDCLEDAYAAADVAIVPLRVGSGLKVKLVEAMGFGLAIVTTSVGAQGLRDLTPAPFKVADEADAFSAAVIDLLADRRTRVELGTIAHAASNRFAPPNAYAALRREMEHDLGRRLNPVYPSAAP